jgi:hypothetical protein
MAAARAPAVLAAAHQPSPMCARGSSGAAASSSMMISSLSPSRFRHSHSRSASLSVVAASTADRTFFVGGNWKSNCTKSSVKTLVKELNDAAKGDLGGLPPADQVEIVVGPEHIHLSMVLDSIDSRYGVSAQNCWTTSGGAYTGEVGDFSHLFLDRERERKSKRGKKKVANLFSSSPTKKTSAATFFFGSFFLIGRRIRPCNLLSFATMSRSVDCARKGDSRNERASVIVCVHVGREKSEASEERRFQIES